MEKDVKDMKKKYPWMIPGIIAQHPGLQEWVAGAQKYEPIIPPGKEHALEFCGNNGIGAVVNEDGDLFMIFAKKGADMIKGLEAAGYKQGFFYVPHSNDCGKYLQEMKTAKLI